MAKINNLLSIETVGTGLLFNSKGELVQNNNILATVKNGKKRGKMLIQTKVAPEEFNFTLFGTYCMRLYEMVLCLGGSRSNALEYAESVGLEVDTFMKLFHQALEVTDVLEDVFGCNLGYFIYNFTDREALNVYGHNFFDEENKVDFLLDEMKKRTK